MEEVSLTETESRYFSDLFLCCDVEKTGKIPMLKATELYRSANLSNDVILEITSLAGIPDTALHISRAQFYSCLKLIAACQASMPLRQELISSSVQLPLPRFSWKESPSGADAASSALLHQSNGLTAIPPPPDRRNSLPRRSEWQESNATSSRRNSAVHQKQLQQQQQQLEAAANSDVPTTDSEVEQNESSCGGGGAGTGGSSSREMHRRRTTAGAGGSPEAWSTNSDSPTPTNSVAERPWAKATLWQGLLGDEHRQLLGTEEESSDRHSSDDDNDTDLEAVYQITPEQREYYFKQFKAVQHDPNGLLSGQIARVFFEKSRIPVEELRHIWQLCDVTRDGALSLAEFTAAMHLVVLRRNNIPLPNVLPACLYPSVLQHTTLLAQQQQQPQEPPEADLLHLNDDDEEDNTDNTIIGVNATITASTLGSTRMANEKNVMNLSTLSTSSQASNSSRQGINASNHATLTPPPLPPPVKNRSISNSPNVDLTTTTSPNMPTAVAAAAALAVKPKDRNLWAADVPPTQWTKFTESPTSNVSSPGPKPVNFDMQRTAQAVVSDPQILHPVPLRVTPVAGSTSTTTTTATTAATAADMINNDAYDNVILRDTSPRPVQSSNVACNNNTNAAASTATTTSHHRDSLQNSNNSDLRAIQRPQAKKLPTKNIGALPPPPQREQSITAETTDIATNSNPQPQPLQQQLNNTSNSNKKEPPPLPPPRPHRHGRSSSLDLNKFKMNTPAGQQPEITAQASFDLQTSTGFADFTHFPDGTSNNEKLTEQQHSLPAQSINAAQQQQQANALPPSRFSLQSNQRVSAFEVYRKPNTPRSSQSPPPATVATQQAQTQSVPAVMPFGAAGAAAIAQAATIAPLTTTATAAAAAALPNAELYEKRVNAISETLRHVSFKQDNNMTDILRHLREQNNLLLRLCNDLSDELLTVQTRREEMRLKLEATHDITVAAAAQMVAAGHIARTGSSISAPVTANITGGSGSSGVHSNV